jgi:cell shape-determining protein MreC
MKMISRSKNNRARNQALFLGVTMAVIVTLLVMTGIFSRGFYGMMVALSGSKEGAGQAATSFSSLFSSKAGLEEENTTLKQELAVKDTALADRAILIKENADLKAAVQFKADTRNTSARVLSKPPFTPFDVVVVDAGEAQGIKQGDRVMIGQTYLGTVTLVSANSSQITLLSSASYQQDAFIGEEALPIILHGKGGGNFETSLPQGSPVKEGDLVFTYYLQTPYYIGSVSKLITNEDNTLMSILITLPVNLYSLTYVEIISS